MGPELALVASMLCLWLLLSGRVYIQPGIYWPCGTGAFPDPSGVIYRCNGLDFERESEPWFDGSTHFFPGSEVQPAECLGVEAFRVTGAWPTLCRHAMQPVQFPEVPGIQFREGRFLVSSRCLSHPGKSIAISAAEEKYAQNLPTAVGEPYVVCNSFGELEDIKFCDVDYQFFNGSCIPTVDECWYLPERSRIVVPGDKHAYIECHEGGGVYKTCNERVFKSGLCQDKDDCYDKYDSYKVGLPGGSYLVCENGWGVIHRCKTGALDERLQACVSEECVGKREGIEYVASSGPFKYTGVLFSCERGEYMPIKYPLNIASFETSPYFLRLIGTPNFQRTDLELTLPEFYFWDPIKREYTLTFESDEPVYLPLLSRRTDKRIADRISGEFVLTAMGERVVFINEDIIARARSFGESNFLQPCESGNALEYHAENAYIDCSNRAIVECEGEQIVSSVFDTAPCVDANDTIDRCVMQWSRQNTSFAQRPLHLMSWFQDLRVQGDQVSYVICQNGIQIDGDVIAEGLNGRRHNGSHMFEKANPDFKCKLPLVKHVIFETCVHPRCSRAMFSYLRVDNYVMRDSNTFDICSYAGQFEGQLECDNGFDFSTNECVGPSSIPTHTNLLSTHFELFDPKVVHLPNRPIKFVKEGNEWVQHSLIYGYKKCIGMVYDALSETCKDSKLNAYVYASPIG